MQTFTLYIPSLNDGFNIQTNDTELIAFMRKEHSKLSRQDKEDLVAMLLKRIETHFTAFTEGHLDQVDDDELGVYTADDFSTDVLQCAYTQTQLLN